MKNSYGNGSRPCSSSWFILNSFSQELPPPPTLSLPLQDFWENDDILPKESCLHTYQWFKSMTLHVNCKYHICINIFTHVYELIIESKQGLELFSLLCPHIISICAGIFTSMMYGIWLLSFNDVSSLLISYFFAPLRLKTIRNPFARTPFIAIAQNGFFNLKDDRVWSPLKLWWFVAVIKETRRRLSSF